MNIDITSIKPFQAVDADPGRTLKRFNEYIEDMKLMFSLVFRKADGTAYAPSNNEKKSMTLLKGGRDMRVLFTHVANVLDTDTFDEAVEKVKEKLMERTNNVVQRNMLLSNHPQGRKSFEKWSQEISDAAQLISYNQYDWKQAAVDAMILQMSSSKLREKALNENVSYNDLIKLGITKEQSEKGAALLEQASGSSRNLDEEVRRLTMENRNLKEAAAESKSEKSCNRCGKESCSQDKSCPALGEKCSKCKKMNHFARVCRSHVTPRKMRRKKKAVNRVDSEDSDSETSGRIIEVSHLDKKSALASINMQGLAKPGDAQAVKMVTDTGVSKTLVNTVHWRKIKHQSGTLVETSKRFRPYGTKYLLPIIGKARVRLQAENGATIKTWVYIVKDQKEQCLLGKEDALRLGIVTINLGGAEEAVETVNRITPIVKDEVSEQQPPFNVQSLIDALPTLFSNKTGKYKGKPIPIQMPPNYYTRNQSERRIPIHYKERYLQEPCRMVDEDIIEGPIEVEEPGIILNNVVLTEKKGTDQIRVTLDCQVVNEQVYQTHEPIPTPEELRHEFKDSNCFTKLDMTNCYHQFEIEANARKLFAFRTPLGIMQFKRMVPGTSPASSEVQ